MWKIRTANNDDIEKITELHIHGLVSSGSLSNDTSLDLDLDDIEYSYHSQGGYF